MTSVTMPRAAVLRSSAGAQHTPRDWRWHAAKAARSDLYRARVRVALRSRIAGTSQGVCASDRRPARIHYWAVRRRHGGTPRDRDTICHCSPGGDRFEDFFDKIGVSLETFRDEFTGGWLFN